VRADAAPALTAGELAVFEPASEGISFTAQTDTQFVVGSAVPHPHDLVTGPYSVHTSAAALHTGQTGIRQRADLLRQQGRL
jgi:hypothetical protein